MAPADPVSVLQQKKSAAESINFLVKPEEKRKYDALFDQLQPVEEKLAGDKVWLTLIFCQLPCVFLRGRHDVMSTCVENILDVGDKFLITRETFLSKDLII